MIDYTAERQTLLDQLWAAWTPQQQFDFWQRFDRYTLSTSQHFPGVSFFSPGVKILDAFWHKAHGIDGARGIPLGKPSHRHDLRDMNPVWQDSLQARLENDYLGERMKSVHLWGITDQLNGVPVCDYAIKKPDMLPMGHLLITHPDRACALLKSCIVVAKGLEDNGGYWK